MSLPTLPTKNNVAPSSGLILVWNVVISGSDNTCGDSNMFISERQHLLQLLSLPKDALLHYVAAGRLLHVNRYSLKTYVLQSMDF